MQMFIDSSHFERSWWIIDAYTINGFFKLPMIKLHQLMPSIWLCRIMLKWCFWMHNKYCFIDEPIMWLFLMIVSATIQKSIATFKLILGNDLISFHWIFFKSILQLNFWFYLLLLKYSRVLFWLKAEKKRGQFQKINSIIVCSFLNPQSIFAFSINVSIAPPLYCKCELTTKLNN